MNYLSLDILKVLKSETYLGQEPVDRATWLNLLTYCAIQESGGVIEECGDWGDRKWQQVVGVTKAEVLRECPLWQWDGDAVLVWGYPNAQQQHVERLRKMSEEASQKSAEKRASQKAEPEGSATRQSQKAEPEGSATRQSQKASRKAEPKGPPKVSEGSDISECSEGGAGGRAPTSGAISVNGAAPASGKSPPLVLQYGKPLPPKCLPITAIHADEEAYQRWEGGGRLWLRDLGVLEDLGPAEGARGG